MDLLDADRLAPDLSRMARWTAWVSRLMYAAALHAESSQERSVLSGAAEDAELLGGKLHDATAGWLDDHEVAVLLAVYDLWDANHERHEQLAASIDPDGFRAWWTRSVGARPPRRGGTYA